MIVATGVYDTNNPLSDYRNSFGRRRHSSESRKLHSLFQPDHLEWLLSHVHASGSCDYGNAQTFQETGQIHWETTTSGISLATPLASNSLCLFMVCNQCYIAVGEELQNCAFTTVRMHNVFGNQHNVRWDVKKSLPSLATSLMNKHSCLFIACKSVYVAVGGRSWTIFQWVE